MKRWLATLFMIAAIASAEEIDEELPWAGSIVSIEINRIQYNHYQPWTSYTSSARKIGVVISANEILTTADWMQDSTLVRVQRDGRGRWWNARIAWIDYHANLATLRVEDPAFWKGLKPAPLAEKAPTKGEVQIWRSSEGHLQAWRGMVSKLFVQKSQRSFVRYMTMEVTSDISASGWSEVVVRANKLAGLVASQDGNRLMVIPAPLIRSLVNAHKSKEYAGLGYFDFTWEYSKNPATVSYLGLEGTPRGVIVTSVPQASPFAASLKPRDIILEVDGFAIDSNADYLDPEYGYLSFYNLATRNKLAGGEVKLKVWRDGKTVEVAGKLRKADFKDELVPDWTFDKPPEYAIVGGLVFQPLTTAYLQSWGGKWWESAPFRLNYYTFQESTPERPHLVFLSLVLPDAFNLGYQDYAYLVVDKINGRKINDLAGVLEALKHPSNGFHIVEFVRNRESQKMVLDAGELEAATARVLQRYGIARQYMLHSEAPTPPPEAAKAPEPAKAASPGKKQPARP